MNIKELNQLKTLSESTRKDFINLITFLVKERISQSKIAKEIDSNIAVINNIYHKQITTMRIEKIITSYIKLLGMIPNKNKLTSSAKSQPKVIPKPNKIKDKSNNGKA